MTARKRIIIVGGGISGLAVAYFLNREIRSKNLPWEIMGIESAKNLGGVVQTERRGHCLIERGPDCFSTDRPTMLDLCHELGLEDELIEIKPDARGLWIREKKKLYELPADFCGLTSMKMSTLAQIPCLSLKGKLRMACEMFVPRRKPGLEESLGEFISRRFGEETLQRLAQPFLGSVFGADLRQISLRGLFPHWIAMEAKHGSLTRAFWAAKSNPSAVISAGLRTLRGGLSVLIRKLHERTGVEWHCGKPTQTLLQSSDQSWRLTCADGRIFSGDAVCLAMPARQAAPLLENLFPVLAQRLDEQPVRSVVLVNALFRREDWPETLRGSGLISGLDESYDLQGASFSSFKFDDRAPSDQVLVRLFGAPLKSNSFLKKTDIEIQNEIVNDFRAITHISHEPVWAETVRYDRLLPSYDLNYLKWKQDVEQASSAIRGFYLTGQSYQPGGLSGCVISAKKTAERMISDLISVEKIEGESVQKEDARELA